MSTSSPVRARADSALHEVRGLSLWIAASIAVHAALLLALPQPRSQEARPAEVLQVVIDRPEPPRVLPAAPQPAPEPLREKRRKRVPSESTSRPQKRIAAAPPAPAPQPSQPPPLVLPPAPAAQLPLPPPQADVQASSPAPQPDSSPRQEVAGASQSAGKSDSAPEVKSATVTPPSFGAAYLRNPKPGYPRLARQKGEEGTVTLLVLVSREGIPRRVSVHTTSGFKSLDDAAVEGVRRWRFVPARRGAEALEAEVLVPIVFKLEAAS